jgi:short-subunit dehydrogenase
LRDTALITGASSGIGEQLARLFAADGCNVVLLARRRERLDALATSLKSKFRIEASVIAEDLSDAKAPERIVSILAQRGINIYALVNNAGFGHLGEFTGTDPAIVQSMMTVNMLSLAHLTRLLLPPMITQGRGRILNVGSLAGFLPGPHMAVYYASKAFVNSFSEALAVELRNTGVSVTVGCPGPTATEFGKVAGSDARRLSAVRAMSAERVARQAYRAMKAGYVIAIPGLGNLLIYHALRFLPRAVARRLTGLLNRATQGKA